MYRKRTWTVVALLVVAACAAAGAWFAARPKPWENTGSYAGPLTRSVRPYDPSKAPSRPWVMEDTTAPPLTRYHRYPANSIGGRETDYLVYLPPGYDEPANRERRYPVVYWLHGTGALPAHGVDGFVEVLDRAIREKVAPPMIAVLPNGLADSWYVDAADGSQPVESVIIKDLIPHVDQTYRTIAEKRGRAVEGFSMGGWGAAHLAFKHPELFAGATIVGGPIHTPSSFIRWHRTQFDKLFAGKEEAFLAEDPVTRARRLDPAVAKTLRIRHLVGTWDGNRGWSRGFHERLKSWNVSSELVDVPDVGHSDMDVYQKVGPAGFRWYRELFALPSAD